MYDNSFKCTITALLHDISAILSPEDMYKYAKELGYQIDPSEEKYHFLLHRRIWDQGGIPPYYQPLKEAINISLDKGCYWFISYQFETHQLLMPHTWLLEAYEKLKQTNEGK